MEAALSPGITSRRTARPVEPTSAAAITSTTDNYQQESPPPPAETATPTVVVELAEQRKIDDAIAKGVWFLKGEQKPDGNWDGSPPVGHTALAGLTLLECGVPASDPGVKKAAAFVRKQAVGGGGDLSTYQWALTILFLDRLGEQQDESLIQYLALCLIAGQHPADGAWQYTCPALDRKLVPQLLKLLEDGATSPADWRKAALNGVEFNPGGWDNSNTQFAILGLWVAKRHGVAISKCVALMEKHFRKTQCPKGTDPTGNNQDLEGSWFYDVNGNSSESRWPAMTCSGLLGLAIAQGVNPEPESKLKPLDDPAIQPCSGHAGPRNRPTGRKAAAGPLFPLVAGARRRAVQPVEDRGQGLVRLGPRLLLPRQDNDGSWKAGAFYGNNPVLNTCFALLFLKQANLAKDLTSKLQLLEKK